VPPLLSLTRGHIRWNWNPRHEAIRTVLRLSTWTVGFVIANQVALWITTVLAYRIKGDYTVFMQAYNFFILPHAIFTVSVISAMQPDLAEKWSRSDIASYRDRSLFGLRMVLAVIVPAAAGYALLAHPILDLIPTSGALDHQGADRIAEAIAWMVIGLPGFSGFLYLVRAFQAMQNARTVFYLYLFENAINVATAFPLHAWFGVNGLAMSQSLAYAVAALVAVVVLRRHMHGLNGTTLLNALLRILAATAVMSLVVFLVQRVTQGVAALSVVAGILSGAIAYLAATRVFKVTELNSFLHARRK
jgi:putative peptidoglycan lipid II flippase